jgi:FtsZ-interacting cell division protein ZipA
MVEFDFSNIGIEQIIGLVLVIIVVPLGIWNMKRRKNKKLEEENQLSSMGSSELDAPLDESVSTETPESEIPLKTYIEQYKSQYSKDALRSALLSNGYEATLVDTCLEKYF